MFDLLAQLSQDLLDLPLPKALAAGAPVAGDGGRAPEAMGSALAYVPAGETRGEIVFEWRALAQRDVRLCVDGWGVEQLMTAVAATQTFKAVHHLPAGRYTYRYRVGPHVLVEASWLRRAERCSFRFALGFKNGESVRACG